MARKRRTSGWALAGRPSFQFGLSLALAVGTGREQKRLAAHPHAAAVDNAAPNAGAVGNAPADAGADRCSQPGAGNRRARGHTHTCACDGPTER